MFNRVRIGLLMPVLLFIISCGKEKSIDTLGSTGNPNTANGKITMTINGKAWIADQGAGASILQGMISIYGMSHDNKNLIITLTGTRIGEYQLDQLTPNVAAWSDSSETSRLAYTTNQGRTSTDAGGKVYVTRIDTIKKTISGTFQFNMFRDQDNGKKVVTSGIFQDLYYGPISGVPGGNPGTGGTGGSGGSGGSGGTGGTGNPTGSSTMTVTIDGAAYTPNTVSALEASGILVISGSQADGSKLVAISVPVTIKAGTYDLGLFGNTAFYAPSASGAYLSQSGKIIIAEHNTGTKKISGTFNFKGTDLQSGGSKQLTNGSFSVFY